MGFDDLCHTGLVLGLGSSPVVEKPNKLPAATKALEPSLTLGIYGDSGGGSGADHGEMLYRQDSATSSFSNASVKRERELCSEEAEIEKGASRVSDEDDDGATARKKLRLNKDQSALLEESFKIHSTLNPKQKQELARKLNLMPRQVEVWFQNRRARTKLKQTEVDCEYLKKCCETLTEENRRLQKELQELKSLKVAQPMYMQLPAATLTMCPSCERIGGSVGGDTTSNTTTTTAKNGFSIAAKPHFFNPFANPSAAC